MRYLIASLLVLILCAAQIESKAYGWGVNDYGQLGRFPTVVRFPTALSAYEGKDVARIDAAGSFHFATLVDGTVYAGGNNWYGQLGLGLDTGSMIDALQNPNLTNCQIFPSSQFSHAICNNNLFGWGRVAGYVLGATDGNYPRVRKSDPTYEFEGLVTGVASTKTAVFITLSNGTTWVAGNGDVQGLGSPDSNFNFEKFTFWDSTPLRKIVHSQSDHVFAFSGTLADGDLYVWGENYEGQLGLGDYITRNTPTKVNFFKDNEHILYQVANGARHSVALTCGGNVLTWGLNEFGQLGQNRFFSHSTTPVVVEALKGKDVVEIVVGQNSNFARTSDNQWYTWGAGYGGVLGNLADADVFVPTHITNLTTLGINQIAIGGSGRTAYGWTASSVKSTREGCPVMVNECEEANDCSNDYSICTDTDVYYKCSCPPGFNGDGYATGTGGTGCTDIDECAYVKLNHCVGGKDACINFPGGFQCTCPTGFHGDGIDPNNGGDGCVADTNECNTNPCVTGAVCLDTQWSFSCTCSEGYSGDGLVDGIGCLDNNECKNKADNNCHANATCTNVPGSYECACKDGFFGNGVTCIYSGDCPDGFTKEGTECQDVDECAMQADNCHADATCTNVIGGFNCTCNDWFVGDGVICISNLTIPENPSSSSGSQSTSQSTSGSTQSTGSGSQSTSGSGSQSTGGSTQSTGSGTGSQSGSGTQSTSGSQSTETTSGSESSTQDGGSTTSDDSGTSSAASSSTSPWTSDPEDVDEALFKTSTTTSRGFYLPEETPPQIQGEKQVAEPVAEGITEAEIVLVAVLSAFVVIIVAFIVALELYIRAKKRRAAMREY